MAPGQIHGQHPCLPRHWSAACTGARTSTRTKPDSPAPPISLLAAACSCAKLAEPSGSGIRRMRPSVPCPHAHGLRPHLATSCCHGRQHSSRSQRQSSDISEVAHSSRAPCCWLAGSQTWRPGRLPWPHRSNGAIARGSVALLLTRSLSWPRS